MPCTGRRPRMCLPPVGAVPCPGLTGPAVARAPARNRGPKEDDLLPRLVVHHGGRPEARLGRGVLLCPVRPVPGPGVEVRVAARWPAAVKERDLVFLVVSHCR